MIGTRPARALALAVALNSASAAIEGRWHLATRTLGRHAWIAHAGAVVPAWAHFLEALLRSPRSTHPRTRAAAVLGPVLESAGIGLTTVGFRRLGVAAAVNGDLFGLVERRPVRPAWGWLRDPIYVGYSLWLAGWAVRTGRPQLLPVAAEMLIVLLAEARIEDWAASRLRRRPPASAGLDRRPRS